MASKGHRPGLIKLFREKAMESAKKQEYASAIKYLSDAMNNCSAQYKDQQIDLMGCRARLLIKQGALEHARVDVAKMKRKAPQHPLPYEILGLICERLNDKARAIACYNRAISLIEKSSETNTGGLDTAKESNARKENRLKRLKTTVDSLQQAAIVISPFDKIHMSDELLLMIFELLSFPDIVRSMRVSKRWRQILESPVLWRDIIVKPSALAIRKQLPYTIVDQILKNAFSVRSIVWQVSHLAQDLHLLRDLLHFRACARLERLEVTYEKSKTASVAKRALLPTWDTFVKGWANGDLKSHQHNIREIKFAKPLICTLKTLADLLSMCPDIVDADVAVFVPPAAVVIQTSTHGVFQEWHTYRNLRRLALSCSVWDVPGSGTSRTSLSWAGIDLPALATAAANLEVLELEGCAVDFVAPTTITGEDFRLFTKLRTLALRDCSIESLGFLPSTLVAITLDSCSRPLRAGPYETMYLRNLEHLAIDNENETRLRGQYGIAPRDLVALLCQPGSKGYHNIASATDLPPLDDYYLLPDMYDGFGEGGSSSKPLLSLRAYLYDKGYESASRDSTYLTQLIFGRGRALRHLAFRDSLHAVTDQVAMAIATTCFELESLSLVRASKLTGAGVAHIVRELSGRSLKSVYLKDCFSISEPAELQTWASARGVKVVLEFTKGRDGNGKKVRYGD